jgi:hypothetical protein
VTAIDSAASEVGPDTGAIRFTRDTGTNAALAVAFTVTGTASNGADYAALTSPVTIPAGSFTATLTVTPLVDALIEGNETVIITAVAGSGYTLGAPVSGTVTIEDLPVVTIAATDPAAAELGPDTGLFTVTRAGNTNQSLTVNLTIGGSAVNGTDYAAISGTVLIAAGSNTATVAIVPLADNLAEGAETVMLSLAGGTGYNVGAPNSAAVTIADAPYDAWRAARFTAEELLDPAISGDTADPDGDGLANLMEYALGLEPKTANVLPGPVVESDHLTLRYTRALNATDVTLTPEASGSVTGGWSTNNLTVQDLGSDGTIQTNQAIDGATISDHTSRFLRLRVTRE